MNRTLSFFFIPLRFVFFVHSAAMYAGFIKAYFCFD